MRECKHLLILVLLKVGFLAVNCDFHSQEPDPVEIVIHDGSGSLPVDKDWDKDGLSDAFESRLHYMTTANGTRFACRLPVRTGDKERESSYDYGLTEEGKFVGFIGLASLLEGSGCYRCGVKNLSPELMANLSRSATLSLCMKSKIHQVDKDRYAKGTRISRRVYIYTVV